MKTPVSGPRLCWVVSVLLMCVGCTEPMAPVRDHAAALAHAGAVSLALEPVVSGLAQPLFLTAPRGDPGRLFIVERGGKIKIVKKGVLLPTPFLDVGPLITTERNEQGLLGLAFHPDYATNRRFYINYTDTLGDTRVVEYRSVTSNQADPTPVRQILFVDQPHANHNGGMLVFGRDGYLYLGLGDGGRAGDPHENGQSLATLLGKILRIDVNNGDPYAIPPDNPFVGVAGARPEIWHYGLRNPWRFSFDHASDRLYIGDVGQYTYEEINIIKPRIAGRNLGWSVMEGMHCFDAPTCDTSGLTLPLWEYDHTQGCSVTGGYVYWGRRIPALRGTYFYGDYCEGEIRSFRWSRGTLIEHHDWTAELGAIPGISSFGVDANNELYVIQYSGTVYRFVPGS